MGRKRKFNLIEQNQQNSSNSAPSTEEETVEKTEAIEKEKVKEKTEFQVFGEDIVLSQIDFINYQKISNKMLFLQFHLLGRFDEKGNYFINNDIKQDLVRVIKEIQHEDDKGYLAEVRFADLIFNFDVELSYSQEGAEAKLYIVEKFDEHTIKTLVDSFKAPNDADFRIKVRERFNLVDVAVKTGDEEVPNLSIWIYWQSEEYMYWRDLYEMGSQFFVLRALSILEGYGKLGEEVINEYNRRLSELEDNGSKRKFSRAKEVLDDVFNKFGGIEKVDEGKGKLKSLAKEYNKPFLASESINVNITEAERPKKRQTPDEKPKGSTPPTKNPSSTNESGRSAGKKAGAKATKKSDTTKKEDAKTKTIYVSVATTNESKKNDEKNNSTHLPTSRKSSLKQDEKPKGNDDGEQSEVKQGIETDKMNITLPSSYNFSNENNFSDNINTPRETWQEKIVQEQDKAITTEAISGNEIACREEEIEK